MLSCLDMCCTQVVQRQPDVATLSMEASQEAALEDLLDHISRKWNTIDLTVVSFKDVKDAFILGSVEDVTAALEDSMVTMSTILASRQVHLPCSLATEGQRSSSLPSTVWHTQLIKESESHHHLSL